MKIFADQIEIFEKLVQEKEAELSDLKRRLKILKRAQKDWEGDSVESNVEQTEI